MADFVSILEGQIEEDRESRPVTPAADVEPITPRKSISRKKLIPIERPQMAEMEVQADEPPEEEIEVKVKPKEPEFVPEPDECPQPPQPKPAKSKGGALWGPPKTDDEIIHDYLEHKKQEPTEAPKSLFDMVMEPPPQKTLEPTLFTYYDKLMQMGES